LTRLAFLSPHEADVASPPLGKLEIRGGTPDGAIQIGPNRSLLVVDGDVRPVRDRLLEQGYRVYDMTAALAVFEVEGEPLMQRLTELDLNALPAIGAIARGTRAIVERLSDDSFRVFVPQELARYVGDVLDHARERVNA
jgi:hypothetical protein